MTPTLPVGRELLEYEWDEETGVATLTYEGLPAFVLMHRRWWTPPDKRQRY